ncbi:MAG: Calx-beta domain-containing protein [Pseudomonadota bacterium]
MIGADITVVDIEEGASGRVDLAFTVQLDQVPVSRIAIPFRVLPSSTDTQDDYYDNHSYKTGLLYFNPGAAPTDTDEVYFSGDFISEYYESVTIELLPTAGIDFNSGGLTKQTVGWLLDDDDSSSKPALWVSSPTVIEGEHNKVVFDLELSAPATKNITIDYDLSGSATAGEDYTDKSGSITFKTGQQQKTLSVNLQRDKDIEALEYLDLDLDLPSAISSYSGGRATIIDDDARATTLPVVTVDALDSFEGSGTGRKTIQYSLTLTEPATGRVSIPYIIKSGTASTSTDAYYAPTSYTSGTAYFNVGESHEIINYYASEDFVPENDESFILELLTPTGAELPGTATKLESTAWVLDDDNKNKNLALQVSNVTLTETDGNENYAVFDLELSRAATKDLTFEYRTVSGSADTHFDFKKTSGKVTIEKGQKAASVGVKIIGDDSDEISETFSLNVKAPSAVAAVSGGLATIINDDSGDIGKTVEIAGTNSGDKYTGNDQKELIKGKDGNDKIYGRGGKDKIYGDDGNDDLYGQKGDDKVYGGNGNDLIDGSGGNDDLYGQNGKDEMSGGNGGDLMNGGKGNDTMKGGKGNDRMIAGDGRDKMEGNKGEDTFIFDRDDDKNFIEDFENKEDMIKINSGADRYKDLKVKKDGKDVEISWAKTMVVLEDTDRDDIGSSDFIF